MDELTKKALKEVQNNQSNQKDKKLKSVTPKNAEKNIDGGVVELIELEGEIEEPNPNKIFLGKDKYATIKPWTGKTKKEVRKIFEDVEEQDDIDFVKIIKTLIYDYIEEDIYLNEGEQKYLFVKIRDISISDEISSVSNCPECGNENNINVKTDDIIHYKENQLPFVYKKNLELVDIPSLNFLENKFKEFTESDDYDGITTFTDVESALHIKLTDKNETLELKSVIEYLDNAPIKETEGIFNKLRELLPQCELYEIKKCKHCRNEVKFDIDVTEDVMESLIK